MAKGSGKGSIKKGTWMGPDISEENHLSRGRAKKMKKTSPMSGKVMSPTASSEGDATDKGHSNG